MGRLRRRHIRIAWGPVVLATVAVAAGATSGVSAAKPPQFHVFEPVADTYVTAARPRANFGRSPVLRVDGSPETTAYLRFAPKKLRGKITSVTLLLHSSTSGRATYAVRYVDDDEWRERTLTYANAPEHSLRYASCRAVARGVWTAVDVTSFMEDGGGDAVSLALTTRGSRALAFGSRESGYGPRLVVRFRPRNDAGELVLDASRRN